MTAFFDLSSSSIIFPELAGAIMIGPDGAIAKCGLSAAARAAATKPPLICHRRWTEARLNTTIERAFDVLELFAFVRPARFCLPTPAGLAVRLGLPRPQTNQDRAVMIGTAAQLLLDELTDKPQHEQDRIAGIAEMMRRGGWAWGPEILLRLGKSEMKNLPPDGRDSAIWHQLEESGDNIARGTPGALPVMPDKARGRLSDMLGTLSEERTTQSDYAAALSSIFASPDAGPTPALLLAEAGTGTGKTLGYLAPASLWAEMNDASVWVSTYTRTLQQQIADELSRLYPDAAERAKKVVIRKGRENYLCLLNLEEALGRMPGQPADAVALGLMARWASASSDGDLTGASFPAWLVDLIGTRLSIGLADRRGECIHSACLHYHKCFGEKSIRAARQADIVIANHALVMIQAAIGGPEGSRPTRYIFDEGHHVFDASDSAFSAALTASEATELRRWLRGAEEARRGRARGLTKRLSDLVADSETALVALEEVVEAARILPATGWRKRLSENSPAGPAEAFFASVRVALYQRSDNTSIYDLQAELYPCPADVLTAARAFREGLLRISAPLMQLATHLETVLDSEAETLDTQTRHRLEGAARGLRRRASGPVAAWLLMLSDLAGEGRDGFVDWMQIDRSDGADRDVGLLRHWLDPSIPFAEQVLAPAHGVAITSATLRDEVITTPGTSADSEPANDTTPKTGTLPADWLSASALTGATHLPHPALMSHHRSPFDYARQSRIFVVNDLDRDRPDGVAAAMAGLISAADGGALGLFTSIQRLRATWPALAPRCAELDIPLYAQHVDRMNLQTLLQLFREETRSVLLGTDAVRDGVDVPGNALQMMIYDRVPWPRPDMLFKARAAWQGRTEWTERVTRMKLRQAFGRLIRRSDDKGVFVMLDSRLPTRLTSAFPADVEVVRAGLSEVISESRKFLKSE